MNFDLNKSIEILSRTPGTLEHMLVGVSDEWLKHNERDGTWSPYDVVGHLIHGERTDWIPRARIICSNARDKPFEPFDRFAQMESEQLLSMRQLLDTFSQLRHQNLAILQAMNLTAADLNRTGIHPALGVVSLRELLATWTVHDLGHIAQIARVMAKQYQTEVGPWAAYLGILKQ